jgi:hypothetical protein
MIRKCLHIVVMLIVLKAAYAQNIVISVGEAQRELSRNESREYTEKKAEEAATIDAIEKAFGRVVIQGNSTFIENVSDGKRTETRSVFNSVSNTFVKGEPLEVLDKKFEEIKHTVKIDGKKSELIDIKCTIKLKVRELTEPKIDFKTHTTPCEEEFNRCKSESFKDGEHLYLYFNTPESGYLNVYADQEGTSFKLLPYSGVDPIYENGMPVRPGIDYLFFSKRKNMFENVIPSPIQTFLAQGKTLETIRLFVIFSKKPLPQVSTQSNTQTIAASNNQQSYRLPNSLPSEAFQQWLQKIRSLDAGCSVEIKDITIQQ